MKDGALVLRDFSELRSALLQWHSGALEQNINREENEKKGEEGGGSFV